jgi:hypothetical protein
MASQSPQEKISEEDIVDKERIVDETTASTDDFEAIASKGTWQQATEVPLLRRRLDWHRYMVFEEPWNPEMTRNEKKEKGSKTK